MRSEIGQSQVFSFLADPATYGVAEVKRIDTHAASVFLAGDRAIKVKRAVTFPFLDYSTLEMRRRACEAEIAVNRPYAPEIYLRALPITCENDDRLALGGTGQPVEWAVEMRRFDESQTLDHLADAGRIGPALADQLGAIVAACHKAAPPFDPETWLRELETILAQNDAALREYPLLFPAEHADRLTRQSRALLSRLRPLLEERGRLGCVRRCHGDLHLGNIVLLDGKPVLFDAIEFDPVIAAGDVLYDLAFLLVDLVDRGLPDPANIVLNRYLLAAAKDENLNGLALLPLFLSIRAAIRAKVVAARISSRAKAASAESDLARGYFELALKAINPPSPILVAVGGLSGTGKSVLARNLASLIPPMPGAVVLRSDVERKIICEAGEYDKLPAAAYEPQVTAKVYEKIARKAGLVISAGHAAIVDAVFATEEERRQIEAVAVSCRVPFRGMFLRADLDTRIRRVGSRVRDASDADAAVARMQERYPLETIGWPQVDASGTPAQTLTQARALIS